MAKKKKVKRNKVLLFSDHMQMAWGSLSPHDCGRLYEMVREYGIEGKLTDVSKENRAFRSFYELFCKDQDQDLENYSKKCETNRKNSNMRWHPDACDGRRTHANDANTIQSKTKQTKSKQTKAKQDDALRANGSAVTDDLSGQEIKGVPGVAWL